MYLIFNYSLSSAQEQAQALGLGQFCSLVLYLIFCYIGGINFEVRMDFNYFDIIVVAIVVIFAIRGLLRGFIKEIISLAGILFSIWAAFTYYPALVPYLEFVQNPAWRNICAYIVIFIIGILLAHTAIIILQRIVSIAFLSWADKLLGFCFGLLKGLLICAIIVTIIGIFFNNILVIDQSVTIPYLNMLMEYVQSHMPSDVFNN